MPARSKPMKRPAAAVARSSMSKKRKTSSQCGRNAVARYCLAILAEFKGGKTKADSLSSEIRDALVSLSKGKDHQRLDASLAALQVVLTSLDNSLQTSVCELQDKLDEEDAIRHARERARNEAEARLSELEQTIADRKVDVVACIEATKTAKDSVVKAKADQKSSIIAVKSANCKKTSLDTAKQSYVAVKKDGVGSSKWRSQLKQLDKVGKELGFHEVLLGAAPAVLKKQPDKRRTFDGITLDQLEKEFSRHTVAVEAALEGEELAVKNHAAAIQDAQESLSRAELQHSQQNRAVADAEEALTTAKDELTEARGKVRGLRTEMKQVARNLSCACTRLSDFRSGPLAAFEALQAHLYQEAVAAHMGFNCSPTSSAVASSAVRVEGFRRVSSAAASAERHTEPCAKPFAELCAATSTAQCVVESSAAATCVKRESDEPLADVGAAASPAKCARTFETSYEKRPASKSLSRESMGSEAQPWRIFRGEVSLNAELTQQQHSSPQAQVLASDTADMQFAPTLVYGAVASVAPFARLTSAQPLDHFKPVESSLSH